VAVSPLISMQVVCDNNSPKLLTPEGQWREKEGGEDLGLAVQHRRFTVAEASDLDPRLEVGTVQQQILHPQVPVEDPASGTS
jgi:hypothetical protein